MSLVLRRLFVSNPIFEEATRAWRKFFRVAGGPGKGLSYAAVIIFALVYVWILSMIMLNHGGTSTGILYFQLVVITLVMPVSIYGAVAGERERSTWEALILTRLTPGQIVVGKVVWRLAGLLLLMVLFGIPLFVGAENETHRFASFGRPASLTALLQSEAMTFAWGFVLCAFGLWVSANTRRSVTSAALIFISLLAVLALLPALLSMLGGPGIDGADFSGNYFSWILMHINPFYALSQLTTWYVYDSGGEGDPLFGTEWGLLQTAIYIVGAGVFLYVTYRSLKIWEEPKHRIG